MGNVVEDIEDRVKSMVGGAKSQAEQIDTEINGQLESAVQEFDSMAEKVESAVEEVRQTVRPDEQEKWVSQIDLSVKPTISLL